MCLMKWLVGDGGVCVETAYTLFRDCCWEVLKHKNGATIKLIINNSIEAQILFKKFKKEHQSLLKLYVFGGWGEGPVSGKNGALYTMGQYTHQD